MNGTTTVKTRSPLLSMPTEVQNAYNAFSVAVKNYIEKPGPETLKAQEDAQAELYRIEDLYREGRKLRWLHAIQRRERVRGA